SFGDAVAVATDGASEIGMVAEVLLEVVEAEHNVGVLAGPVGNPKFGECRPIGNDFGRCAFAAVQRVFLDFCAIGKLAEYFLFHFVCSLGRNRIPAQTFGCRDKREKPKRCQRAAKCGAAVHGVDLLGKPRKGTTVLPASRKKKFHACSAPTAKTSRCSLV